MNAGHGRCFADQVLDGDSDASRQRSTALARCSLAQPALEGEGRVRAWPSRPRSRTPRRRWASMDPADPRPGDSDDPAPPGYGGGRSRRPGTPRRSPVVRATMNGWRARAEAPFDCARRRDTTAGTFVPRRRSVVGVACLDEVPPWRPASDPAQLLDRDQSDAAAHESARPVDPTYAEPQRMVARHPEGPVDLRSSVTRLRRRPRPLRLGRPDDADRAVMMPTPGPRP